jgi:ketosteroid isomerase-like protein
MKNTLLLLVPVFLLFYSCNRVTDTDSVEIWKQEVREVERDFAAMAVREGMQEAFLHYAAEDAVLMRNDKVLVGREKLREYFAMNTTSPQDEKLSWKPDFVDVSASGDLAYTYGHYSYSYTDSTGTTVERTGIFHTVWKRQADGSWRYVWD